MSWVGADMPSEKQRRIAKTLALIVVLASILVVIGWIFDIALLKSLSPFWVSMKFDTAVAFFLSGIGLYFMARAMAGEFDLSQIALSITSLILMLLMGTLFLSAIFGIHTGVEELFIKEMPGGAKTPVPGQPSLLTMLAFMLVATAGMLTITNLPRLKKKLKLIGVIVGFIGALAVLGYIVNIPLLYYFVAGVNTAMACNTAILFILLGTGLACLSE
jgi:hypothetical protein